jgi:HJR/Mrr/RecB family endonuclease
MKWLERHPQDVDRVHHRTFEVIVSEIIKGAGWSVELTKQTRDGGFDLMCLQNDCVGTPVKMLAEIKLYNLKHSIGLPMIDRLMGVRDREHANRAVLVTNSRFSKTVWKLWKQRVGRDLALVDRDELLEWLLAGRGEPKWSSMPISSDGEVAANPESAPDSQRALHVGCQLSPKRVRRLRTVSTSPSHR